MPRHPKYVDKTHFFNLSRTKSVLLIFFQIFWISRLHLFINWYHFLRVDAVRCYRFRDRYRDGLRHRFRDRWNHWTRRRRSNFWWLFFSSETQPGIPNIFGGLSSPHLVISFQHLEQGLGCPNLGLKCGWKIVGEVTRLERNFWHPFSFPTCLCSPCCSTAALPKMIFL